MTPTVIDIPASLATLVPSTETSAAVLAWLVIGFAALLAFGVLMATLSWLQTPSKPKVLRRKTESEPLSWLPKKYVAPDHH